MEKEREYTHCAMHEDKKRLPILKINIKLGTVQEIPRKEIKSEKEEIYSPFQKSISEMVKKRKRTCENALVNQNSKRAALQPFSKILEFNRQRENREKIVEANFNTYIDHLKEIDSKGILPEVSTLHNYIFNDDSVVRNEENN